MDRKQFNKLISETITEYRKEYQSLLKTGLTELAKYFIQSKIYGFVDCLRRLQVVELWKLSHLCDELIGEVTA